IKFQRVPITERNLGLACMRREDSRHLDRPSLSTPHNARHGTALDLARPPGPLGVGPLYFLGPVARRKAAVLDCGVWAHIRVRQNDVCGSVRSKDASQSEKGMISTDTSPPLAALPAFTAKLMVEPGCSRCGEHHRQGPPGLGKPSSTSGIIRKR
ncbi:hypothetical protein BC828DRAFT_383412, partial [Blastocladiella britannica]